MHKVYNDIKIKDQNISNLLNSKDEEILDLTNKINDLDINIEKYEANLISIRKNYDNTVYEYQQEIQRKNEDIKYLFETLQNEKKEVKIF